MNSVFYVSLAAVIYIVIIAGQVGYSCRRIITIYLAELLPDLIMLSCYCKFVNKQINYSIPFSVMNMTSIEIIFDGILKVNKSEGLNNQWRAASADLTQVHGQNNIAQNIVTTINQSIDWRKPPPAFVDINVSWECKYLRPHYREKNLSCPKTIPLTSLVCVYLLIWPIRLPTSHEKGPPLNHSPYATCCETMRSREL